MFPAQALAEAMLARGWRVKLSTDARGARYAGGFPDAVEIEQVASGHLRARRGAGQARRCRSAIAGGRRRRRCAAMRRDRPAVVVGFGGYPAIPALAAATLLRMPRMIHEQNGVLGRVNQLFAQRVDAVACGTWPTELPEGVEGVHTGNPVRRAVLDRAGAPYIPPGDYPMSLLVIGGSQGARILSDVVPRRHGGPADGRCGATSASATRRGTRMCDRVADFYAEHGIDAEVQPFFDDMPRRHGRGAAGHLARRAPRPSPTSAVIGRPVDPGPLRRRHRRPPDRQRPRPGRGRARRC